MAWFDGVSDKLGKVMVRKSENSTHSSLLQSFSNPQPVATHRPFMAESCGGCDDDTCWLSEYDYQKAVQVDRKTRK